MSKAVKQRFIELLEQEAAQQRELAQAWRDIQRQGGGDLRDKDNQVIATAEEMVQRCIAKEQELRAFSEQVKAL